MRLPPDIRPTIAVLRTSQGLSLTELAALAGVSYQLVHNLEKGRPVSREYAERVCDALGVRIDEVVDLNIRE